MWNGLTIALDKTRGSTPTTIINFMKARGFNMIRLYTGWGNGKNRHRLPFHFWSNRFSCFKIVGDDEE